MLQIAEQLGLIQLGENHFCRHPLTYLLEAADDMCYALIDLEDGITLNMLTYSEVEPIFLDLIGEYGIPSELNMQNTTWQQKIAALRGRVMKRLVDEVTTAFAKQHWQILSGQLQGCLLDYCAPDISTGIQRAASGGSSYISGHYGCIAERLHKNYQSSYLNKDKYSAKNKLVSTFLVSLSDLNEEVSNKEYYVEILENGVQIVALFV